jgi:coenzyme F420-0:L-glutamate ligase/coenzyme F420-1:gamma-L-glutamate ligase
VITIAAPDGIGEVGTGTDLVRLVLAAAAADPIGPLRAGDIVVVTSKIVSKAEGRRRRAAEREAAIGDETVATVAWRGTMRIVRTRLGLVQAAAGVDASNVDPADILILPEDPDASAERLRAGLSRAIGGPVGVVVSDTAGRAWRIGQTDHAIGAAGVRVRQSYAGEVDGYGNPLQVTVTAVADELAAAADLVKGKLSQRPVAVIRGLDELVVGARSGTASEPAGGAGAAVLIRTAAEDMFGYGAREAVVAAVLAAIGRPTAYGDVVGLDGDALVDAVLALAPAAERDVLGRVLRGLP